MPDFDPTSVIIEDAKIPNYLLALGHRIGGSKARFFIGHGFDPEAPHEFADALRDHVAHNNVSEPINTGFGTKWVCDGPLKSPDGENPRIRSVWILDFDGERARLVSAYPIDEDK